MSLVWEALALYEGVVTQPDTWTDQALADWAEAAASVEGVDRTSAKSLRRVLNTGSKLRSFWMADARVSDPSIGWKSRVDIALGPKAWRPVLDLGLHDLDVSPDESTFEVVGEMFRVVNNRPWLEGVSYEEWLADSQRIR